SLAGALPRLLGGAGTAAGPSTRAQTVSPHLATTGVDPLARLRTPTGLAGCIASLTGPDDSGLPLALDYASFEGKPALVVLLPDNRPSKVDFWVVGPTCTQAESALLYYARVDRPT
ncbi:MAG: hypothetical protein JWO22_961, partial [Frankiales bacterium]|nr:hypothetical protein [Frankiales bacterium]